MIISQSPALAVQRSQRSFRCCLVTLRSCGPAVDRDPKTRLSWGMQSRPRAVHLSLSRPLSFCSMCHEQLSLSHRPSLQSLASVVVGEMLRQSETYPRRLVSSRLVLDRGMKNCLPATSWRTRSHCCPCSTSELTANFFWDRCSGRGGSASKIDDASVQFRFCARHFVPMVPPSVITIRMRTLLVHGRKKRKGTITFELLPQRILDLNLKSASYVLS